MPSTIIQIRRRITGADPGPGQLAAGELGYAFESGKLFIGAVSPSDPPIQVGGFSLVDSDISLSSASNAFYFGPPDVDGTWRIIRNGSNLEFQRRITGSYVMQFTMP